MIEVTWLPTPPSDGSVSMNRYWSALDEVARRRPQQVCVQCPLGSPSSITHATNRWRRVWGRYVQYPVLARRISTPIVHVLDQSCAYLLKCLPDRVRTVVTVHDLIPLRDSQGMSRRQLERYQRGVSHLRQADLLLAVSQHTANELQDLLGIAPERIIVASNGVDEKLFAQCAAGKNNTHSPGTKRLLSIGSAQQRKNLEILPEMLEILSRQGHDICLVRVGDPLPGRLRLAIEQAVGPDRLIELGRLADDELPEVYRTATALFFPSTQEGFGLPLLEAMAAGLPVASSWATSLPEVGGDAAIYFDPESPSSAAQAVGRLLDDSQLQQSMRERGLSRVLEFTWDRHFDSAVRCYESLNDTPAGTTVVPSIDTPMADPISV